MTAEDVDRVVAGLAAQGLAASTRRGYVQAFKSFPAFLIARKAGPDRGGVRLVDAVDEFNAARHVGADSPSANVPPGPHRMEEFFDFLKERIATARKLPRPPDGTTRSSGRCIGPDSAEAAASLDRADVHFGGPPPKVKTQSRVLLC